MSIFASARFLRRVLWADAASCCATGALQLLFAPALAQWLRLPAPLLAGSGYLLLAFAVAAGWAAARDPVARPLAWLFVAGNLAWATGCLVLLAGGWVAPSALGVAWILAQLAVVAVLAELEWMALRRSAVPGWA